MTKRIALVTGGTGGIGSCICRQLSADGFTVVANYIAPDEEKAQAWLASELSLIHIQMCIRDRRKADDGRYFAGRDTGR